MTWESQWFSLLVSLLVRPLALAAAAWLLLRLFKIRHPASCHAVWTAVLAGMLLLPVVGALTPHWTLPVLPAVNAIQAPSASFTPAPLPFPSPALPAGPSPRTTVAMRLLYIYAAGFLAILMYRVVGWVFLWRVISRSHPLRARLRESGGLVTPVAIGVLHPTIILPAGWRQWSAKTRRAVLAHEFAHLRRHDALVSALARLVKIVFWFHPLAWWLARKVSDLAELACDAAALGKVQDPAVYSRILLQFADAVQRSGRRIALPGLAMAATSGMGRRIDHVFELSSAAPRKLTHPGLLLALAGLPWMCLAATVEVEKHAAVLSPTPLPLEALPMPGVPTASVSKPSIHNVKKIAQAQQAPLPAPTSQPRDPYRAWLNEDVAYIISDAERIVFAQLAAVDEREKFIEQFWQRRDPTPGTPSNEYKEEHYRRIAYVNEHFRPAAGLPGWKTDRGRIYIVYGPPDEIDAHPAGGLYQRPASEGGGSAVTYAFEQWRYRYFGGVGNLTVEFVDPTSSGEYRMSLDPTEKYRKP